MRFGLLTLFFVGLAGCQCNRGHVPTVEGEVRWQWETPEGLQSDSSTVIAFPDTDMGAHREQVVYVQNVGSAPFTMAELAKVSGSAITLGLATEPNAAFEVKFDPAVVVGPSERTGITVYFNAPITPDPVQADYATTVELRPHGAPAALISFSGRALAPECLVPEVIDFGSIPVRTYVDMRVSLRNTGMAPVTVTAGTFTGVPEQTFFMTGLTEGGSMQVAPGASPEALLTFRPNEVRDYAGEITFRRSAACPVRTAKVIGRGVKACLTWRASPSDDPLGSVLNFGNVFPSGVGPGTVVFENNWTLGVQLAQLHTSDAVFLMTKPTAGTSILVPAATRDVTTAMFVASTEEVGLEFRPSALGARSGQLLAITSAARQPELAVNVHGYGGGPRLDVKPPVLAVGRLGFTPGASPGAYAERTMMLGNVGTLPVPADPLQNLRLGAKGAGAPYFTVRAIGGTTDELCLGAWDEASETCSGTLAYDPATGIEAGHSFGVPARVTPKSAGLKDWEVTITSNDTVTPTVTMHVTAEAIAAPPCAYTVMPAALDFGTLEQPAQRDLSFTLTNDGTAPTDVCYFNGLSLSPATADDFTLVTAMTDFAIDPGHNQAITVRAKPLRTLPTPTQVSGAVQFAVSKPVVSQGSVPLSALIATTCITFAPNPADFPDTELECGAPERSVVMTNNCNQTVTVKSTVLTDAAKAPVGSGSCATSGGCPQFALSAAPALGPLAPGQSRTMKLGFQPFVTGPLTGQVTVTVQQGTTTISYVARLTGTGITRSSVACGLTVSCPPAMTVNANTSVSLSPMVMGPISTACQWSAGARPSTSSGTFSAPSSCTSTTYFADVAGTHVVNLSVSDAAGDTAMCSTTLTVKPRGDLWIELTWDKNNDMDLHFLHPNAGDGTRAASWGVYPWDCNWTNLTPVWSMLPSENPSLDRDDTTFTGPENTRIDSPPHDLVYTIGAHAFSMRAMGGVTSTVKVYCAGSLVATRTRAMSVVKDMWVVGTVTFKSDTSCVFKPIDTVVSTLKNFAPTSK